MMKSKTMLAILAVLLPFLGTTKEGSNLKTTAPLCFIRNNGEVKDQYGSVRTDIQFQVKASPSLSIYVSSGNIHYQFMQADSELCVSQKVVKNKISTLAKAYNMYRVDVNLLGASLNARIETSSNLEYHEFHKNWGSQDTAIKCPTTSRVVYKEIYPNIDEVLYVKDGHLEYDFIVRKGGRLSDIRMRYDGATKIEQINGGICISSPFGQIYEGKIYSYTQENKEPIACNYKIEGNQISFEAARFEGALVIDPSMKWGTYFGGTNAHGTAVSCSADGSVYMCGYTSSPVNIATIGAYSTTFSGVDDAYLAKFDSSGNIKWATYFGGPGSDEAFAVLADNLGDVYLAGQTESSTGIATSGAYQGGYGGNVDAFLAKFSSTGSLLWATYVGGSGLEICKSLCTDTAGNVYMTGYTSSIDSIATAGTYKDTGGGDNVDVYIEKFSSSGARLWGTYYGGNDDDEGQGIVCDKNGNLYVTGGTGSTEGIATANAYVHCYQSYDDAGFLAKFNQTGGLVWGTYFGANGSNGVHGIATDKWANVFVSGSTCCTDSMATPGAWQSTLVGPADAFLMKFDSSGHLDWGTYYGTAGDGANAMCADTFGNLYLTGSTISTTGIATAGAYQGVLSGGQDAFIAEFSNSGSLIWATYYGGPDQDDTKGISCDKNQNIYITGNTTSTVGVATAGAYDTVFTASTLMSEAILARLGNGPGIASIVKETTQAENIITIAPDPASDQITVSTIGNPELIKGISLVNMCGQLVYKLQSAANASPITISVANLPNGLYECLVNTESGTKRKTFVVTRH